jgi:predicted phosphodiesterase
MGGGQLTLLGDSDYREIAEEIAEEMKELDERLLNSEQSTLGDSDYTEIAEEIAEEMEVKAGQGVSVQASQRPETIITWLHLSDLHFRESRAYDESIVLKALLRDVAKRIQTDDLRPDFIAITGDIAFSGKPEEYAMAQSFFDDLLTTTGLPCERLFIVPGNHDVDRDLITAGAKAIGASLIDRACVNTFLATPSDRRLVLARFKGYEEFVNDYFADHLVFDDEHYFYVQIPDLSGRRIALLGLNSAWLCASDRDKEQGLVIGERQTRAALDTEQAADAEFKIALLHHPLDWLREFDQNDSAVMLLDSCDFVLHGHLHRTEMAQLVTPDSGAMVIASGACYETRQYPNSYNFVRLDLSAGAGTVYLRRYSDAGGGFWAKDTLTYRNVPDGEYTFAVRNSPPP